MTNEQLDTILSAWKHASEGDSIKDAFDFDNKSGIESLEDAFVLLCEDHFGKDFIGNWELGGGNE